jgi:hypothetical protein
MSGALWLLAILVAATGAALIGFALNGWRRQARLRLWKAAKRVVAGSPAGSPAGSLRDVAPATMVCLQGKLRDPYGIAQPAAFSAESAVYQRLILEEWKRDWCFCFAEVFGERLAVEYATGETAIVNLAGAKLLLKSLSMRFATQMFDEEDYAEYTDSVPEVFRARIAEYLKSHPGTYRVRSERLPVGAMVFVIGEASKLASTESESDMVLAQSSAVVTFAAQPEQPLYVSDLSERELFRPASLPLQLASAMCGVALLVYGIWLLLQHS